MATAPIHASREIMGTECVLSLDYRVWDGLAFDEEYFQ